MLHNFLVVFYDVASTKFYIYKENYFKINSIDTTPKIFFSESQLSPIVKSNLVKITRIPV